MNIDDYYRKVSLFHGPTKAARLGQAFHAVLCDLRPDLVERIQGTNLDPFYNDANLPAFLVFIQTHWVTTAPALLSRGADQD